MAIIETTISTILATVKTLLESNKGPGKTLSSIKVIKRGVLPPQNPMPLIALIPTEEQVVKKYSSNLVSVNKNFDIFIYNRDYRGKQGVYDLETMVDQTKEILVDNYLLPVSGTQKVIDTRIGRTEYGTEDTDSSILNVARLPISCYVREQQESPTRRGAIANNPTGRTLVSEITTFLKNEKSTTLGNKVHVIRDGEVGPESKYPAIYVSQGRASTERRVTGADAIERPISVDLLSKIQRGADEELTDHLDIVENMKTVLEKDPSINSYAWDSEISNIQYGAGVQNNDLVYRSSITMLTTTRDLTPDHPTI